ncbi:MAG: BON domain-containing protein [Acidobacteriota bacterium]|nr:BON domain-containing protein [Acidobacteriota bacterium]
MRFKLAGIIAVATLALSFAGCNPTTNDNANAPANANSNAVVTKNANANANTNTRRAPTREEYEKNKQTYAEEAKSLGRKVGTGLDDGWLWTKTRFDLAAADDLKDSTINVDVQNGVVTLSGSVDNAAQKAKADAIAKAVSGVKNVKNLLTVTSKNSNAAANSNQKKTSPKNY